LGRGVPEPSPTMDGKEERRLRTAGATWHSAAARQDRGGDEMEAGPIGWSVATSRTRREKESTKSL